MMHFITQNRIAASRTLALGVLLAALLAAMLIPAGTAYASTTFTVTNTNDSGQGSLRQAIMDANNTPGADTINFNIPGSGVHTITPANELPAITDPVIIDGYSQPGSHPNTKAVGNDAVLKIELSGASAPGYGLFVIGSNSTIKGLVVNRWAGAGVVLIGSGSTGNKVVGNFIGTDATGTQDYGNSMFGVYVNQASGNTIGGTTAGARNVISGNEQVGVYIEYANSTNNRISGNYIGTDRTGTKVLGNSVGVGIQGANNTVGGTTVAERNVISGNNVSGVNLYSAAGGNKVTGNYVGTNASGTKSLRNSSGVVIIGPNNIIGGTTAGSRNVISGNSSYGIYLFEGGTGTTTGNKIVGNYVGTDKSGTKALGNDYGVNITGASNTTIGGTTAGARNVISANDYDGVYITGQFAKGNKVVGNYVGTARNGTEPLGNGYTGVTVRYADNTTIGGTKAGARNVISANGHEGVFVSTNGSNNRVLSNSIFANGRLGIDLSLNFASGDGPTANDPGDADTGPNGLQNKPLLASAKTGSTKTTVKGKLNSTPAKTFTIQFFSNPRGNEGKTLIGQKSVTTDGNGDVTFTFSPKNKVAAGQLITATATGVEGTSEFSTPKKVVAS